jgi:hypothetical protein
LCVAVNKNEPAAARNDELTANWYLSVKPKPSDRYNDFYEKVIADDRVISGPAQEIDKNVTAKIFPLVRDDEDDAVFNYIDTASTYAMRKPAVA